MCANKTRTVSGFVMLESQGRDSDCRGHAAGSSRSDRNGRLEEKLEFMSPLQRQVRFAIKSVGGKFGEGGRVS